MAAVINLFKIPLSPAPQQFEISLASKTYTVVCKWNDSPDAGWVLDFSDATTGDPIVFNVPLITGADLLAGLGYLGFEGELYVVTDGDDLTVPTYTNLGVESNLYFNTDVST